MLLDDGAGAVKEAWSLSPAATVQVVPARAHVMVVLLALAIGPPPAPPKPDMKQVDEVRSTKEAEAAAGTDVNGTDDVTVAVLLLDADKADVAVKRTVYAVDIVAVVLVGVTETLLTAPDGVPIV